MKRTATAVMLTATILMGGGLVTSQPIEASASTAVKQKATYTTTDKLNLRTGASTKYKVILTIPKGKSVSLISSHGTWSKVKYGSKTGYVSNQYLKITKTKPIVTPPKAPATSISKSYTTTANLNLRTKSSTSSSVVTTIPKGKNVQYLSTTGSWYKVKYGSKTGYVSSKYLKTTTKATVTPTPKPTPKSSPSGRDVVLGTFYTIDSLNMRSGGGIEFGVVSTVPKGGKVEHIATSGNWYKINYGSKTGWVNASYLSKTPLNENEPNAGVKWLASEAVKRTDSFVSEMKRTSLKDPFLMPVQGRLTSPYGIRSNPTGAGFEFHTGVDYANATGTPILATADAMVDRVVSSTTGYGRYIVLRHDMAGMTFYSLYAHLHKIEVTPGEKVKRGERIGQLGSTGRSTGPHLHFEIQNSSRQSVNAQTMLSY